MCQQTRRLLACSLTLDTGAVGGSAALCHEVALACGCGPIRELGWLALFEGLILRLQSSDEHILNLLAVVEYGLKTMRQLEVGV